MPDVVEDSNGPGCLGFYPNDAPYMYDAAPDAPADGGEDAANDSDAPDE